MWWIFIIPIVAIVLGAFIKAFSTSPSQELNNKFVELGVLRGKTYTEISSVVGEASSKDILGDTVLCQWIQPAYHISLIFDRSMVCLGVQSETKIDENII